MALVALLSVVAAPAIVGAQSTGVAAPARRGLRPIHRIALPSAALGTVLPLAGLLPLVPMFRHEAVDPNSSDDRFVYMLAFDTTTAALGGAQVVLGAGLETAIANRLGRRDPSARRARPFAWSLLGQSIGWVAGMLATVPAYVWVMRTETLPPDATRKAALGMFIAGPLIQAWGGSYLGAFFLERHPASGGSARTIVPVISSFGDVRSPYVGVAGTF